VPIHSAAAAQQQEPASLRISQLGLLGAPAALLYALPAFAADEFTVDAAYEAVQQQSAGSTDLVVSVLAAIVFTLLVVVTAGVSDNDSNIITASTCACINLAHACGLKCECLHSMRTWRHITLQTRHLKGHDSSTLA
jgi:hypothetical protein